MRLSTMTLLVLASLSGCKSYTPPDFWTVRADCRARASQRNEDFSLQELLSIIKQRENHEFLICTSPNGAGDITNAIKECNIELESCKQRCR